MEYGDGISMEHEGKWWNQIVRKTILKFSLALARDEEGGNHFSIFCNLFESMMKFESNPFQI